MIEKPYLVHWSDDSDSNTETTATLEGAQAEIDRWLDLRRREADDGWALDMTGCIAVIVERVVEEESEAPEGSSFDRHVDYHREKAPDPRDARITALEGENAALKGRLRETCQILVESVGGLGPCNAEDAARRAAEVVDQLRAQLAAPLRLGRGPTVEEVDTHEPASGLWLTHRPDRHPGEWHLLPLRVDMFGDFAGQIVALLDDRSGDWLPIDLDDAIPLDASRQPCGVGVTQGQAVAKAFKDLAKKQTSLDAEASAALASQDLWDMYLTDKKETP